MNNTELNIRKKKSSKAICFGSGLLALDVITNGNANTQPKFLAGGSCGNVLSILSFLGWKSYPIARLSKKAAAKLLVEDLQNQKVHLDLVSQSDDGSTPVIIHRILKDSENNPKHRYEFRIPKTNTWFPSYKPVLSNKVENISAFRTIPKVFYLDRVSRATIDLAKYYKENGSLIFFEPSSISEEKQFKECLALTDILKFSNDRLPQFKDSYPIRQVSVEIETLGANGLLFRSFKNKTDDWKFLPALHVDNALDTAGAGDWCSAAIIHAVFENFDSSVLQKLTNAKLEQILVFGQFLSALNCTFYGARGLMYHLTYQEISKLYVSYQTEKKIEIKKKEPGFNLTKTPFDFSKLL
ncbi:MAG TPA: carbohydrate kinase family protein [Flavitalea sp.]|nr:carbohydrate kinase family protein [Flavitalea sp.]